MSNRQPSGWRLCSLYPLPSDDVGISHICLALHEAMDAESFRVSVVTPMVRRGGDRPFVVPAVPRLLCWLPYRRLQSFLDRRTVSRFLKEAESCDVAYLWSEIPLHVARALRAMGKMVVREKFNCHKAYGKRILDDEYASLGLPRGHSITQAAIDKEREELGLADHVFSPSPMVRISLIAEGVRAERIIDSSYGWDPKRFRTHARPRGKQGELTVAFVGSGIVRKGIHLLLDAWSRAGVRGRLLLAGPIAPDVSEYCARHLARDDVEILGFVTDVGSVFQRADVFAFPSLEEGSPLVTYEAMAHGVPVIVSPMGAGPIARDGVDGYVLDPRDTPGWIEAFRSLAEDPDRRLAMSQACTERAQEFTWERVGARRREALIERCAARSGAPQAMDVAP